MKKLKLDLETLDVASFETEDVQESRGTVDAHSPSGPLVTWAAAKLVNWLLE